MENLEYISTRFEKINPSVVTEIIIECDKIFVPIYRKDRSRSPLPIHQYAPSQNMI